MKKFLVLALALGSVSAFAQKHMVVLDGFENDNARARSLDLSNSSNDNDAEFKSRHIALNYAYAISGSFQIGAKYDSYLEETDGDKTTDDTTMGLKVIYNLDGKLTDTNYLAFHYNMINNGEDESDPTSEETDDTQMILEFGHRFSMGKVWGMDFNWSPSVEYSMYTAENGNTAGDDDLKTNSLTLNVVKFDVIF